MANPKYTQTGMVCAELGRNRVRALYNHILLVTLRFVGLKDLNDSVPVGVYP
jgi:hypothetical protein